MHGIHIDNNGNVSPTTPPEGVQLTPGGVAVVGVADRLAVHDEAQESVVRGPWQHRIEPAAPASTQEALDALAITWREYSEWRATKCPPPEFRGAVWLDELDQAIHEMMGELGELAQLLSENGPFVMAHDPETARLRKALEDEIGDLAFTASWVFDCIDPSFFGTRGRVNDGFLPPDERDAISQIRIELAQCNLSAGSMNNLHKCSDEVQASVMIWVQQVNGTMLTLFGNAALISNRFKKVRWHRVKDQHGNPFYEQAQNLFMIMVGLDAICALTGISLLNAVHRNRTKLDRRYPEGWMPGGGKR